MPTFLKVLAVVVLVVMLIGSYSLGNNFKTISTTQRYSFSTPSSSEVYNIPLALGGAVASIVAFSLLFSLGLSLEKRELTNEYLSKIATAIGVSYEKRKDEFQLIEVVKKQNEILSGIKENAHG